MELKEEWSQLIKKEEEIFIYGAGKYGKAIWKLLKDSGKEQNVSGFLVSDLHNNPTKIEGKQVYAIKSLKNKNALILIAVSDQFQEEILIMLDKLQFYNVVNAYKYAFLEWDNVEIVDIEKFWKLQYVNERFSRYDIAVRLLAIEEYFGKNTFGMSLYKKMQNERVHLGYGEISEERFVRLIMSWEKTGYDPDSEIIVDQNMHLIDGAHRLALAIYYRLSFLKVRIVEKNETTEFGNIWFQKRFDEKEIQEISDRLNQIIADFRKNEKSSLEKLKEEIYLRLGKNQKFGKGNFYQSFEELSIEGQRPTEKRINIYGLNNFIKDKRVFDIGCNCGFLDLCLGLLAKSIKGIEYNKTLVEIGEKVRDYLERKNVSFEIGDFKEYITSEKYDVILSFAVHYWIGLSIKEYCKKVVSMLETAGYLVFESQNIKTIDTGFEEYCNEFAKLGLKKIREGEICDDECITRKFVVFQYFNDDVMFRI